jgi:flagellar motor switch protein FliG|tara:strand:- start:115 stop:1044 length:930 start_codon:yes stop_codon:yes gene_type:complete
MSTILENFSGFDKAAILLHIFGDSLAMTLFKTISDSEMIKLRLRSRELQNIPPSLKKAVMEEYYFKIMSDKYRDKEEPDDLFGFLRNLDEEQLYCLLVKEEVRMTALALDQLTHEARMSVLNKLDPIRKNKIVIQIGSLKDIPLEAVISMARELEEKVSFIPGPKEFTRGGGESVATILGEMSENEAGQYMEQLKLDNSELYDEVKKYFLSYDDLMALPDSMGSVFWMNPDIDLEVMAKALKGFDEEIINKIVEYLPAKKQAMYTPIDGPMSKREVDTARAKLLDLLKEKFSSGEWNIEDVLGGGEMIE